MRGRDAQAAHHSQQDSAPGLVGGDQRHQHQCRSQQSERATDNQAERFTTPFDGDHPRRYRAVHSR